MSDPNFDQILQDHNSIRRYIDPSNLPSNPGQVEITNLKLISPLNFNINIDLQFIFTSMEIAENIFSPYVEGYIKIVDTVGHWERIPIVGDEFLHVTFKSKGSSSIDEIDKVFRIVKMTNFRRDPSNDRVHQYTLEFRSIEYILNIQNKVQKCYGKKSIGEMVKDIYSEYISHPFMSTHFGDYVQEIDVEDTSGQYNITIPNMTPFQAFSFLSSRSMSSNTYDTKSFGAFYSFYETLKYGFQFRSLESIMQNEPTFNYFYAPNNLPYDDYYKSIAHGSHNISEYYRISGIAVDENLKKGMYANRLITHNMLRMKYDIHDLYYKKKNNNNYENSVFDPSTQSLITRDSIQYPDDLGDASYKRDSPNIISYESDFFKMSDNPIISHDSDLLGKPKSNITLASTNEGSWAKFAFDDDSPLVKDPNIRDTDIEKWFSNRKMQKILLNSFIYNVKAPGNTHRSIGDILFLDIPTALGESVNSPATISSGARSNTLVSGNYITTRVAHVFTKDQADVSHTLSMHVMKDSLSRKLPLPIMQFGDDDSVMGDEY